LYLLSRQECDRLHRIAQRQRSRASGQTCVQYDFNGDADRPASSVVHRNTVRQSVAKIEDIAARLSGELRTTGGFAGCGRRRCSWVVFHVDFNLRVASGGGLPPCNSATRSGVQAGIFSIARYCHRHTSISRGQGTEWPGATDLASPLSRAKSDPSTSFQIRGAVMVHKMIELLVARRQQIAA